MTPGKSKKNSSCLYCRSLVCSSSFFFSRSNVNPQRVNLFSQVTNYYVEADGFPVTRLESRGSRQRIINLQALLMMSCALLFGSNNSQGCFHMNSAGRCPDSDASRHLPGDRHKVSRCLLLQGGTRRSTTKCRGSKSQPSGPPVVGNRHPAPLELTCGLLRPNFNIPRLAEEVAWRLRKSHFRKHNTQI